MECYGHYYALLDKCQTCELMNYCKDAKDLPLLGANMAEYNDTIDHTKKETPANSERFYSREEVLVAIGKILALDTETVQYLEYFCNRQGTMKDYALSKGVSKQALHKYLKSRCESVPFLADVLLVSNVDTKNIKNFRRKVWKIQERFRRERKLKKQNNALMCWKKLICLNQSSGSFSTNTLKGVKLWKKD